MAFDGIVTKAIASELQELSGARIDKIFEPNKNNVLLGFYLDGKNYLLNICTDIKNYRIHLTTNPRPNPKVAPNFCMVLRKHLIGLHIKNIITNSLERIVTIEFEGFDDIDDIISKKLVIELMGKHCNIILLDDNNVIIDSLRHINNENSTHIVIPHIKYTYPVSSKYNFMDYMEFDAFRNVIDVNKLKELPICISNKFNGISKTFVEHIIAKLNITILNNESLLAIFEYIKTVIVNTDSLNLEFEIASILNTNNKVSKDYFLMPSNNNIDKFSLNFFIDDFYYKKETSEDFRTYRDNILKLILSTLKMYQKRLFNINEKLKNCDNMDVYKLYGELITSNLYRIKNENLSEVSLENYYDNNNLITIPLDKKYTPSENAKRFFKKYNKLKNALEIVGLQKFETEKELEYIESIVYELEEAENFNDLTEIFDEISNNDIFKTKLGKQNKTKNKDSKIKKSNLTKNKNVSFNPLKYTIDGYTLLVGRNNKENDYLSLKYAHKTDLWFHVKDIPGSHGVLLINSNSGSGKDNTLPPFETLVKCAEIVAKHSKARNSSNVPVDYCEVKYVKKPNGAKPGMVIYTNNKTIVV